MSIWLACWPTPQLIPLQSKFEIYLRTELTWIWLWLTWILSKISGMIYSQVVIDRGEGYLCLIQLASSLSCELKFFVDLFVQSIDFFLIWKTIKKYEALTMVNQYHINGGYIKSDGWLWHSIYPMNSDRLICNDLWLEIEKSGKWWLSNRMDCNQQISHNKEGN